MKSFVRTFIIVSALVAPALSQAQDNSPATQPQQSNAQTSGYGGTVNGNQQAGSQQKGFGSMHGQGDSGRSANCTGPVSYCSIFFGS